MQRGANKATSEKDKAGKEDSKDSPDDDTSSGSVGTEDSELLESFAATNLSVEKDVEDLTV